MTPIVVPVAEIKLKLLNDETPEREAEAKVRPPVESTLNFEVEAIWKSRKLPEKAGIFKPR